MEKAYKYVINEAKERLYFNDTENIRILKSANVYKLIVAKEISRYYSATSRHWDTIFREDVNAKDLACHLNRAFPEFQDGWEARTLSSQQPFDIVHLGLNLIIELKSVKASTDRIIGNATVYPDRVKAVDALPNNFNYPASIGHLNYNKDAYLDVLVVCVDHVDNVVNSYAIVDGSYWGVTEEIYLGCKDYFSDVNEYLDIINKILVEENENAFAEALTDGTLGNAVNMYLRKLINFTNPVGRLSVEGRFNLPS